MAAAICPSPVAVARASATISSARPSASLIWRCFSPSLRLIASSISPMERLMRDSISPTLRATTARLSRSARIWYSIDSSTLAGTLMFCTS